MYEPGWLTQVPPFRHGSKSTHSSRSEWEQYFKDKYYYYRYYKLQSLYNILLILYTHSYHSLIFYSCTLCSLLNNCGRIITETWQPVKLTISTVWPIPGWCAYAWIRSIGVFACGIVGTRNRKTFVYIWNKQRFTIHCGQPHSKFIHTLYIYFNFVWYSGYYMDVYTTLSCKVKKALDSVEPINLREILGVFSCLDKIITCSYFPSSEKITTPLILFIKKHLPQQNFTMTHV